MKNTSLLLNKTQQNLTFVSDYEHFAQKICQKVPFSNILLLMLEAEYFEFGKLIYDSLLKNHSKVQVVVLSGTFYKQIDDLLIEKTALFDFRGIAVCDKKLCCYLLQHDNLNAKIFHLQLSSDIFALFNDNRIGCIKQYFCVKNIDTVILLKTLSVRTLCLIDYYFTQVLIQTQFDQMFFNKVKKLIVSSLTSLIDEKEDKVSLFEKVLSIEKLFALKKATKYFSSNVACYLMQQEHNDLELNFCASKKIIKIYKKTLLNKFEKSACYVERARLVSFLSGQNINLCLKSLNKQVHEIHLKLCMEQIQQLKSLIKIYDRFVLEIESKNLILGDKKDKHYILKEHKLDLCISVCGDTLFGKNGMSYVREMNLLAYV